MENGRWCPTAAPFRGAPVHTRAPPPLSAPSIPDPQPTNLPEVYLPLELLQIPVTPDNQVCWHRHSPVCFCRAWPSISSAHWETCQEAASQEFAGGVSLEHLHQNPCKLYAYHAQQLRHLAACGQPCDVLLLLPGGMRA